MSEEKINFVGSNKVAMVSETIQKTPMGSAIVEVTYENGHKECMPKKTYELVVTDIPSDASIQRKTKFNSLVPAIIAIICEYDLKVSEIQALLQEIGGSIDNSFGRAVNFKMCGDDTQFVPNSNPLYDRSILEADAILKSIPATVEAQKNHAGDSAQTNTSGDQGAAVAA